MKMSPMIFIIFLSFCLYDKAESESHDLYEQMQKLNASCYPLDSCRTFNDSKEDHLWNDRKCECGPHCVQFETCCADSAHVFKKVPLDLPESEYCQKLKYFPTPVMMVSQCDNNWKWSPSIVEKCERNNYSSNNRLFTNIPLTNVKTLTTYKNYFCAVCNYGGKDFLYWNVGLTTRDRQQLKSLKKYQKRYVLKNIKYDVHKKKWVFLDESNGKRFRIKVRYVLPSYLRKMVKPCYADLIQTCKSSRSKPLVKQYCQAYYSPIEIKTQEITVVYKNIYCVICNNVDTSSVKISSCLSETSMRAENTSMSFAILIDVNLSKGNKVGRIEVPEPDCGVNAIYDPFANKCRKISCVPGTGRVLVNGKCVPK